MPVVLPVNHWSFQLANIFLFLSYLQWDLLALRLCLTGASACFALWGALVLSISVDTTVWNSLFFVMNSVLAYRLWLSRRPVDFKSPLLDKVYQEMFGPSHYDLSRQDFLALSRGASWVVLSEFESYAVPGSEADCLSLLVEGQVEVLAATSDDPVRSLINVLLPGSFLDSPQWMARKKQESRTFLVEIRASRQCLLLVWPYSALGPIFATHPKCEPCLDYLCGLDVASKIFRMDVRHFLRYGRAHGAETLLPNNRQHAGEAHVPADGTAYPPRHHQHQQDERGGVVWPEDARHDQRSNGHGHGLLSAGGSSSRAVADHARVRDERQQNGPGDLGGGEEAPGPPHAAHAQERRGAPRDVPMRDMGRTTEQAAAGAEGPFVRATKRSGVRPASQLPAGVEFPLQDSNEASSGASWPDLF